MTRKAYISDLTDAELPLIQPLLPPESVIGHPREVDFREILNGIFYVQREGCGWPGPNVVPIPHWMPLMIYHFSKRSTTISASGVSSDHGSRSTTLACPEIPF